MKRRESTSGTEFVNTDAGKDWIHSISLGTDAPAYNSQQAI